MNNSKIVVIVGSLNPVKINATERAFLTMFPHKDVQVIGYDVPSGVSHQPMTDEVTRIGAINRATAAQDAHKDAHYWVGIEGGVEKLSEDMIAFAWMCVRSTNGVVNFARTSTFVLPPEITRLIQNGKELGEADDIVFGKVDSKRGIGAVGILTDGRIDRTSYYQQAIMLALIPFLHPELYFHSHH